ncbi:MAG: hypothetical protein ACJ79H_17335 [Myxococcales bacterium]
MSTVWPAVASDAARTVTVVPGARYHAGWLYRFFFGAHWRDAWTTPIEVPVLDLETFDGGLKPERLGGGLETTNLHFKSGNGRTWAFRSVDKDPIRTLDPDTRESLLGDIYQDVTSSAHPCGALVVGPLLEAAGILHATPQLAVLPDDPRLAEFGVLAGTLGLLEERIEHRIEGARMIADTLTLFARLEQRSDERVDARAYLRARLIDVLVGDWDRHIDQWRWVRFDRDGQRTWQPVPRDRDEAFSRFDGIIPSVVEYYNKPIAGFARGYPPIDKLTFAGRYTDRRFLVSLDWMEWRAIANDLVARLTDSVISDAVRRLPLPLYEEAGAAIESALRSRRDALPAVARDYYRLLADQVDVRGTANGEDFRLERQANGAIEVSIRARDEQDGMRATIPFFRRTFLPEETSEIRLYTMGGDDRVEVDGETDRTIPVHTIPPHEGAEPSQRRSAPAATTRYASLANAPAAGDSSPADPQDAARGRYETFRDWGRDWLFYPRFSYDSTRGLVVGGLAQRTAYGRELDPFASEMGFGAEWSTGTNRPRLEYSADLRTHSPVRALVYLAYSGMDVVKFYGTGNETPRDPTLVSGGFYDVRQELIVANPVLEVPLAGPLHGRLGALFKHASSVQDKGILAARPEGTGGMTLASAEAGLVLDTRTGTFPSRSGVAFQLTGRHTPKVFSNPAAFTKLRGEVEAALGGRVLTDFLFDARFAGERNWGAYPFFESAFLGGASVPSPLDVTGAALGNPLRGYDLNRFAGDASVVGNAELNVGLGKFVTVLPLRYGLVALADVGRVFVAGQSSSRWHTGYGGGVWMGVFASGAFFQFVSSVKATVVHSDEGTSFYLFSGFGL